jgi:hypothetical protein
MLDRVGLRLLASALSARARRTSLRYAAQKLPVEAARWLRLMAATGATPEAAPAGSAGSDEAAEARRLVAREVEEVAAGLRRRPPREQAPRPERRAARPAPPASDAAAGANS